MLGFMGALSLHPAPECAPKAVEAALKEPGAVWDSAFTCPFIPWTRPWEGLCSFLVLMRRQGSAPARWSGSHGSRRPRVAR